MELKPPFIPSYYMGSVAPIDTRYFDRNKPTLPSGEYYQPWHCSQNVKDYWWGNAEPVEDEC